MSQPAGNRPTGVHSVMLSARFTELSVQCLGRLGVAHLMRLLLNCWNWNV